MKKRVALLLTLLVVFVCAAQRVKKPLTTVNQINGVALHTIQSGWVMAERENSADTQTDALGVTELTKGRLDTVIAANANEEEYISYFRIPAHWNAMRFRAIGITNGATFTHQIYLGTLGDDVDCELTYAGQLAWVIGTQSSIYDQITFTSGGTTVPAIGDKITGNTSGATATIVYISALSGGAWADGDAAGTIAYKSASGAFTNSETISISRSGVSRTTNGYTHANSDLIDFELADTCVTTAKSWGSAWTTTTPADNTNAEAEIDVKGGDIMVVVTTVASVDGVLLVTGY